MAKSPTNKELKQKIEALEKEVRELTRANEKLQTRYAGYEVLVNSTPEAMILTDPKSVILTMNQTAAGKVGRTVDEVIGLQPHEFMPGEIAESRTAHIPELIRTGKPVCWEDESDGMVFDTMVCPVFDAQGEVEALAIYARDITERKLAERALIKSEERYRRLVESSFQGIAIHNTEQILYINPAGAELIGAASPNDLIGRSISDFIHPADKSSILEKIAEVQESSAASPINEDRLIRMDGQELNVEMSGVQIDYQGAPAIQIVFSGYYRAQTG